MTRPLPASLARLAHANPVAVDDGYGLALQPQAELVRILARERDGAGARWPRRRRVIVIALVATVVVGCGAFRAADPFGFWRSAVPDTARFGVDPTHRVTTPTARSVGCRLTSSQAIVCVPAGAGRRYDLLDRIGDPVPASFDRASVLRYIAKAVATGGLSVKAARRLKSDVAAVSDSFFADFRELGRFQTLEASSSSTGQTQVVPPRGVPAMIVCEQQRATLDCRNLNGDEHAPVGAAIYAAVPAADWVTVRSQGVSGINASSEQMIVAIFGRPFSAAEARLLLDLLKQARPVSQHGSGAAVAKGHSPAIARTAP